MLFHFRLGILFALCLPLVSIGAVSQETETTVERGRSFAIGVHGGANFSNLRTPSDVTSDARTGFLAGLEFEIPLSHNISLQPEVTFAQRNAAMTRVGTASVNAQRNALEVPLFLKLHLGSTVRPFLLIGPQGTWNISSSVSGAGAGQAGAVTLNPNTFEWGATGGVGLDIGSIFVSGRYQVGITDADATSLNWQSRGFQILGGIRFL